MQYAEYFRDIGDKNLSWKYIQKAFEENQNEAFLEKILKAKSSFFEEKDETNDEKNLIKRILEKTSPEEEYFMDYDLDPKFKSEIVELADLAMEENDKSRVYFSNGMITSN